MPLKRQETSVKGKRINGHRQAFIEMEANERGNCLFQIKLVKRNRILKKKKKSHLISIN